MDLESTDPATIEAVLVTDKGPLVVTFFPEQAPRHVRSFLTLALQGFYDGVAFHRIIRNFMVQLDVLDAIASVECDFGSSGERSKPKERVEIRGVELRPRQQRESAQPQQEGGE